VLLTVITLYNVFKATKVHESTRKYMRCFKTFISLLHIVFKELENLKAPLKLFENIENNFKRLKNKFELYENNTE